MQSQIDRRHDIFVRIGITVVVLLAYRVLTAVPLPGIELEVLRTLKANALSRLSIMAISPAAWFSAVMLAELAILVLPTTWTKSIVSSGHANPFAFAVIILTLAFATLQASGIAKGLEDVGGLVTEPGTMFRVSTIATLIAGVAVTIALARAIDTFGVGWGFWIIVAATSAVNFIPDIARAIVSLHLGSVEPIAIALFAAAILTTIYAIVFLINRRREAGFLAGEPVLWPIQLCFFLVANLVVPAAYVLASGSMDDDVWIVTALWPTNPFGLPIALIVIAAITLRYAQKEGSRALWPISFAVFLAVMIVGTLLNILPQTANSGLSINPASLVLLTTVSVIVLQSLRARWNGVTAAH